MVPDAVNYNAMISACEKGKHPEWAVELFQAMLWHSVMLDRKMCSGLLDACEKISRSHHFHRYLDAHRDGREQPTAAAEEGKQGGAAASDQRNLTLPPPTVFHRVVKNILIDHSRLGGRLSVCNSKTKYSMF